MNGMKAQKRAMIVILMILIKTITIKTITISTIAIETVGEQSHSHPNGPIFILCPPKF